MQEVTTTEVSLLDPSLFNESYKIAERMVKEASDILPMAYRGKPMMILLAADFGRKLGFGWLESVQSIAIINGHPSLYGDAMLALVQGSSQYEWIKEGEIISEQGKLLGCYTTVKRKHHEEHTVKFTIEDAKKADLWDDRPKIKKKNKDGGFYEMENTSPWYCYAPRMLQMRARAFALRNVFSDALRGIRMVEEVRDYRVIDSEGVTAIPDKKVSSTDRLAQKLEQLSQKDIKPPLNIPAHTSPELLNANIKGMIRPTKPEIPIEKKTFYSKAETVQEVTEDVKNFIKDFDMASEIGNEPLNQSEQEELERLIGLHNMQEVALKKLEKRGLKTLSQLGSRDARNWIESLRSKKVPDKTGE